MMTNQRKQSKIFLAKEEKAKCTVAGEILSMGKRAENKVLNLFKNQLYKTIMQHNSFVHKLAHNC